MCFRRASRATPQPSRLPKRAAQEQRAPGRTEVIEWEDADGKWHTETAPGGDRPETDVEDSKR